MGVCASSGAAVFARLYDVDEAAAVGKGSYGAVFHGRSRRSGDDVVVKRIDKAAIAEDALGRFWEDEAAAMQQCTPHPNIIELLHVYESPTYVYLVTEKAQGGELFDALISEGAYSEWDAKRFARGMLEALTRIHGEKIVHRDIKPENLLLTAKDPKQAHIKISDFGTAMPIGGTSCFGCAQLTWAYCAPEVLREMLASQHQEEPSAVSTTEVETVRPRVSNPSATPKSDIWSIGIVLYVLLSGIHPFDPDGRQTKDQIISNVLLGKYSLSEPALWEDEISSEAKELLKLLLSPDPAQRPTAKEALAHAWFLDPTTPRLALQVSISKGLGAYQLSMQKKFRTSVIVAMAAQSLRRSLERIRNSKSASSRNSVTTDEATGPTVENVQGVEPNPQPTVEAAAELDTPSTVRQPSATSKLFARQALEREDKPSEHQSMDLIDEFDGDTNTTRPPQPVD